MTTIVVSVVTQSLAAPGGVSPANKVLVTAIDNSGAALPPQTVDVSSGSGSASFTGADGAQSASATIQALDSNGTVFGDVITVTQLLAPPVLFNSPTSASSITVS